MVESKERMMSESRTPMFVSSPIHYLFHLCERQDSGKIPFSKLLWCFRRYHAFLACGVLHMYFENCTGSVSVEMLSWPLRGAVVLEKEAFKLGRLILQLPAAIRLAFLTSGGLSVGVSFFQRADSRRFMISWVFFLFGCIRYGI